MARASPSPRAILPSSAMLPVPGRHPRRTSDLVIPGLVPGIQLSASGEAASATDPGDKHRDDSQIGLPAPEHVESTHHVRRLAYRRCSPPSVGPRGPYRLSVVEGGHRPPRLHGRQFRAPPLLPARRISPRHGAAQRRRHRARGGRVRPQPAGRRDAMADARCMPATACPTSSSPTPGSTSPTPRKS